MDKTATIDNASEDAYEVRVENLTVSFGDNIQVLNGINLQIKPMELVAVVGENGAGKSTLLKAIAGEVRYRAGKVVVGGQTIRNPINKVIDRVSVVHQRPDNDLVLHLSIAQNIAIRQILTGCHPMRFWGVTREWLIHTSGRLARANWEATEDLSTIVGSLSGGQMQMLNTVIAMHLENGEKPCRLLLLDEHTSALDHKKARTIMDYTHREALRSRCTVLMVTHRYEEAFRFANRIIVLHEGKVLRDLNKADLNSSDDIRNIVDEA